MKPLCVGLGGVFAFDLFLYADGVLFGRLDPAVWSAHGAVQACVIPFVAVSTVRNREWTVDIAVTRQVVFHTTALLGSGSISSASRRSATTSATSAAPGAPRCRSRCSSPRCSSSARW